MKNSEIKYMSVLFPFLYVVYFWYLYYLDSVSPEHKHLLEGLFFIQICAFLFGLFLENSRIKLGNLVTAVISLLIVIFTFLNSSALVYLYIYIFIFSLSSLARYFSDKFREKRKLKDY